MRLVKIGLSLGAAGMMPLQVVGVAAAQEHAHAPNGMIAGTWEGGFLSTTFKFEFTRVGETWNGRFWSDKAGKWAPLQNLVVTGNEVRFALESKPPSIFDLTLDGSGKSLDGSATFGAHPPLPLTLTKSS